MKRQAAKGKDVLLHRFASFVANDSRLRESLPAGNRACPETPQERSDEEAQAAPRGKRPPKAEWLKK